MYSHKVENGQNTNMGTTEVQWQRQWQTRECKHVCWHILRGRHFRTTVAQPVSCTFGRRSHGLLKAGGRQLLFWFRFLRNHGNFKDSLKFQSHKHKDNAHNDNRRYFHKYWTRHFDLMGERKGDVWCSWECKNISGNVPLVGGASSFLGTTTFFSGTFFLTSGTLKTPFHDKNVFWRARKKARSLYTQKDHHATFTQKRDRMQAAAQQEMTEIFRERN